MAPDPADIPARWRRAGELIGDISVICVVMLLTLPTLKSLAFPQRANLLASNESTSVETRLRKSAPTPASPQPGPVVRQ